MATGVKETHLGQIGVLPSARGRGLAKATIASVLRAAAERGFHAAALQPGTSGRPGRSSARAPRDTVTALGGDPGYGELALRLRDPSAPAAQVTVGLNRR